MNIRFLSLELQNFRSIDKVKVIFDNQGTVIVKGINEYEKNATSNGSGKSSIFEGIIYALFEETSSGEKDVENRIIGNGFIVKLELEIEGIPYTIYREGKKGKSSVVLYKNNIDISARNKTDTNKLIVNLFGISKAIFLDSIFLSQNAVTNLASLQPTARKERLEVLTNTDSTINLYKEKLKQQQLYYESQCVETQLQITQLNGNKEVLEKQKIDIQTKIDEINEQLKKRDELGNVEEINQKIENLQRNMIHIPEQIKEIDSLLPEIENELNSLRTEKENTIENKTNWNNKINDKRQEYNKILSNVEQLEFSITINQNSITKIEKQIIEIQNSDKCPTCGRKYENSNEEHIQQTIEEYQKEIKEYNDNIENTKIQIIELQNQLKNIEIEGKQLNEKLQEIQDMIDKYDLDIKQLDTKRNNEIIDMSNLQKEKENIELNINQLREIKEQILSFEVGNKQEFEIMLVEIDNNIKQVEENIVNYTAIYTENNDLVNSAKHILQLVTKEFRTYLLQNSLSYLNKQLEKYSSKLFSNTGDIIKISEDDSKLDILLGNASYESLSGGERTRVNIALLLAQKSLANIIGNISCNIIILDEILGYCDAQAETKVIDLIMEELDSLESIYMVSHKEIPIGYDTQLIIIKDKLGLSRIKSY